MIDHDIAAVMPRPRSPAPLSDADRQRRHVERHDLRHLRAPRSVMDRVDAISRDRSVSRAAVLVMLLDEWDARRVAEAERAPLPLAAAPKAGRPRHKVEAPEPPAKAGGANQPDLFAALKGEDT